jgi:hypothetical protein
VKRAVFFIVLLPACSLSGIDRFDREECDVDSCCTDLNTSMPTGDPCLTWQSAGMYCEPLARDMDGDDARDPACPGAAPEDCDDADPARSPIAAEICDGVDNDCNDLVDDAPSAAGIAGGMLAELEASATQIEMTAARDGSEIVIAAFETDEIHLVRGPAGAATPVLDDGDVLISDGTIDLTLIDGVGPLASVGNGRYAMLAHAFGCPRWVLARIEPAGAEIFSDVHEFGLPKLDGSCMTDTSPVGPAAMAADEDGDLAIAWLEDGGARACGTASSAPIVLTGGRVASGTTDVAAAAMQAGMSDDASPPALLAIGDDDFLMAAANAGTIELRRLSFEEGSLEVDGSTVIHTETANGGDLHLALGPSDATNVTFVLSWREGCAAGSRVLAAAYSLARASSSPSRIGAVLEVATGSALRAPRAVWQPRSSEWAIAWRSGGLGVSVQRYLVDFAPIGGPVAIIETAGVSLVPALVARPDGPLYGVDVARFEEASASIHAATFGCAPP